MNRYLLRHLATRPQRSGAASHLTRGAQVALAALALGLVAPGVALAAPGDLQFPERQACPPLVGSCDITLPDPIDPDPDPEPEPDCPPVLGPCNLGIPEVDPEDPTDEPDEPTDEPGDEPDEQVDPPVRANPTFTG